MKACKIMTAAKQKNNVINGMKTMPYKTHDSPLCPFLWKRRHGHKAVKGTTTNQILVLISLAKVLKKVKSIPDCIMHFASKNTYFIA